MNPAPVNRKCPTSRQMKQTLVIAFGKLFLSNPTLVTKLSQGAALTPPDMATFYTPGEKGYTDYP